MTIVCYSWNMSRIATSVRDAQMWMQRLSSTTRNHSDWRNKMWYRKFLKLLRQQIKRFVKHNVLLNGNNPYQNKVDISIERLKLSHHPMNFISIPCASGSPIQWFKECSPMHLIQIFEHRMRGMLSTLCDWVWLVDSWFQLGNNKMLERRASSGVNARPQKKWNKLEMD